MQQPASSPLVRVMRKLRHLYFLQSSDVAAIELIVDDALRYRTREQDREIVNRVKAIGYKTPTRLSYMLLALSSFI